MSPDQPFIWRTSLGVAESLGISKTGQIVLMVSQIWHKLAGSVGGAFRKGQWPLLALMPTYPFLPLSHWCLSSCYPGAVAQKEWVWVGECLFGFFKRKWLRLQQFLPPTQSLLVFAARSCGDLSSWHWNPGLGSLLWGWDSLYLTYPSWTFLSTTHGCGTSLFCICAPPTSLDGCGFFNSVIVRLLFN